MAEERQNFIYGNEEQMVPGCIKMGISESLASHIFDEMSDFAKYAFNKSHAACYSIISYQTAYLKYYYPKEFMAATISSVIDHTAKVAEYILCLKQMGISLLPPDVNKGNVVFSVSDGAIRFGLSAIKNIGHAVALEIIKNREEFGEYKDIEDFINRLSSKEINKRSLESLIKAGAMDSLPGNRRQKLAVYMDLIDEKQKDKKSLEGQMSLFDIVSDEYKESFKLSMPKIEEMPRQELLSYEKEMLGIYVSGHPLEDYTDELLSIVNIKSSDFADEEIASEDGKKVLIGGMISSIRKQYTRNNQLMAFIQLEDLVGSIEVILFPKVYDKYKIYINEDEKIYIEGRINASEVQEAKLICEDIYSFLDVHKQLWLRYENQEAYEQDITYIQDILDKHPGSDELCIYLKVEKERKKAGRSIDYKAVYEELKLRLGEGNVGLISRIKR